MVNWGLASFGNRHFARLQSIGIARSFQHSIVSTCLQFGLVSMRGGGQLVDWNTGRNCDLAQWDPQ
jgi:hypothetical protein